MRKHDKKTCPSRVQTCPNKVQMCPSMVQTWSNHVQTLLDYVQAWSTHFETWSTRVQTLSNHVQSRLGEQPPPLPPHEKTIALVVVNIRAPSLAQFAQVSTCQIRFTALSTLWMWPPRECPMASIGASQHVECFLCVSESDLTIVGPCYHRALSQMGTSQNKVSDVLVIKFQFYGVDLPPEGS